MANTQSDIRLGILTRPHGVAGGIRCRLDHPGNPEVETPVEAKVGYSPSFVSKVELVRCDSMGQQEMLCFFAGRTTREAVEELVDMALFLPRQSVLYGDAFGTPELIGLEVIDQDGRELGRIVGILRTAGHPVLEIRQDDYEWLLPAVEEFVRGIDPDEGVVEVELIPGLYDSPEERADGEEPEEDPHDR